VLRCGKKGFGFPPEGYPGLIGKRAVKFITKESLVTSSDVE
jgi:hypothetical protein